MVLGALTCPLADVRRVASDLRSLKSSHGRPSTFEAKWKKVSPAGVDLYGDLLAYFVREPVLRFRAVLIPDKGLLRHDAFGQDHDTWYYKMYFTLLEKLVGGEARYSIYLDIKDSRSGIRAGRLHEILCNSRRDFDQSVIRRVQPVRSHEVEQIQLADLLAGAVAYAARDLRSSEAKIALVRQLELACGRSLTETTPLTMHKFNVLRWSATSP